MNINELPNDQRERFCLAGKASSKNKKYKTQEDWEKEGAKKLIKKVFGFFGKGKIKTLDELSDTLIDLKFVSSKNEGIEFINELYGKSLYTIYGNLEFEKVWNKDNKEACKIILYDDSWEDCYVD